MYCLFRKFGEGKRYNKHMVITNNIIDIVGVIFHNHMVYFRIGVNSRSVNHVMHKKVK